MMESRSTNPQSRTLFKQTIESGRAARQAILGELQQKKEDDQALRIAREKFSSSESDIESSEDIWSIVKPRISESEINADSPLEKYKSDFDTLANACGVRIKGDAHALAIACLKEAHKKIAGDDSKFDDALINCILEKLKLKISVTKLSVDLKKTFSLVDFDEQISTPLPGAISSTMSMFFALKTPRFEDAVTMRPRNLSTPLPIVRPKAGTPPLPSLATASAPALSVSAVTDSPPVIPRPSSAPKLLSKKPSSSTSTSQPPTLTITPKPIPAVKPPLSPKATSTSKQEIGIRKYIGMRAYQVALPSCKGVAYVEFTQKQGLRLFFDIDKVPGLLAIKILDKLNKEDFQHFTLEEELVTSFGKYAYCIQILKLQAVDRFLSRVLKLTENDIEDLYKVCKVIRFREPVSEDTSSESTQFSLDPDTAATEEKSTSSSEGISLKGKH